MNQSEILTIICNLLKKQQTSCAQGVPLFLVLLLDGQNTGARILSNRSKQHNEPNY